MTFWIIVSLLALAVAGLFAVALLGRRTGAAPAAAYDLQVYRDQLKEIDRDLGRGVIGEADADRIRAEVSRRILAADAQAQAEQAGPGQSRTVAAILSVALAMTLLGGSLAIYRALGTPGDSDLPLQFRIELSEELRQSRPGQDAAEARMPAATAPEIEADYAALLEQLRAKVAGRPDDLAGHVLLARHEANAGNYAAAHKAQAQVIDLMGDAAGPEEYLELAELMILATAGYVSPDAEAALRGVLEKEPVNGPARYYWGLMQAQIGRPDLAFETWERTLQHGPPDAPWLVPIRAQIEEMAWRAGVEFDLPAPPMTGTGPSQADVAAAGEMSEADRQEMIRGMVDRLAERLASEGGGAEDWTRLIAALAVLGDADRAQQALADARTALAGNDAALAEIDTAARKAGLIQ